MANRTNGTRKVKVTFIDTDSEDVLVLYCLFSSRDVILSYVDINPKIILSNKIDCTLMPLTPAETERLYEIINLYTDTITEILKTIRDGLHTKETYQDDEEYITGFVHGCIITHYLLKLKYQYGRELKVDEKKQVYDAIFEKTDVITSKIREVD